MIVCAPTWTAGVADIVTPCTILTPASQVISFIFLIIQIRAGIRFMRFIIFQIPQLLLSIPYTY